MKKKQAKYDNKSISYVVVFREDLEEIIHSLEAKGMKIKISDQGFEYETLDEVISQRGERINELDISGQEVNDNSGSLNICFSKEKIYINSWGTGAPRELLYEIHEFLRKRRSIKKILSNPFIWYSVAILAFNVYIFGFLGTTKNTPFYIHGLLVLAVITWPISYLYSRFLTTVRLTRHNEGGFFSRNREAIILLIIGAVLGGLTTFVVTLLTK